MIKFFLEKGKERLITHTGLIITGMLIFKTNLAQSLNKFTIPESMHPDIKHSDVIISYIGLLCQGKTAFEDIEEFRDDEFFAKALGLEKVPSA